MLICTHKHISKRPQPFTPLTKVMESSQAKGGLQLTAVQAAGEGGMGEEEVVEVGVLLEWRNISSSIFPWPDGEVATSAAAFEEMQRRKRKGMIIY